jgi:hypothetical protein
VKIRWTPQAENDRIAIVDYIAIDNLRAAIAMDGFSILLRQLFPIFRCVAGRV